MTDDDRQTDRQADHATKKYVATGENACTAMSITSKNTQKYRAVRPSGRLA